MTMELSYQRGFISEVFRRLKDENLLIQVIVGPRQVGKTTGVLQLIGQSSLKSHYCSADDLIAPDRTWLIQQWQKAILLGDGGLLVVDEIQKIIGWQEIIKKLWDERPYRLKIVLLGSSSLMLQKGLPESLAGRFELIKVYHWGYNELREAFGYDLERYLRYGGYPGAVRFEKNFERWYAYVKESIIEAVIGRDILNYRKVANPALFRQAFEILCRYPAQEISYNKLLGQLQDKGNTDLVKYYIELFSGAFLVQPVFKYSRKSYLKKSSSPKILPSCPALYTLQKGTASILREEERGRLLELAVGNILGQLNGELAYFRDRNAEVDFVLEYNGKIYAIEVKSGRKRGGRGLEVFLSHYQEARPVIIDTDNFPAFDRDPAVFLRQFG